MIFVKVTKRAYINQVNKLSPDRQINVGPWGHGEQCGHGGQSGHGGQCGHRVQDNHGGQSGQCDHGSQSGQGGQCGKSRHWGQCCHGG